MTESLKSNLKQVFNQKNYRVDVIDSQGHNDGVLCVVKPGLIVSLKEIKN